MAHQKKSDLDSMGIAAVIAIVAIFGIPHIIENLPQWLALGVLGVVVGVAVPAAWVGFKILLE